MPKNSSGRDTLEGGDEYHRELLGLVPPAASVKGLYIEALFAQLQAKGHERPTPKRYFAFKEYPLVELMELLLVAAPLAFPGVSLQAALRSFGRTAYPTLAATTAGKVIFSVAGTSFSTALKLSSKAYAVSLRPGEVKVRPHRPGRVTLELRDIWNFPDSYQPGVIEGAMAVYGVQGTVELVRLARRCDVDLEVEWDE